MRTDNVKVKITIPIPINKPDKNGIIYTEDAITNALRNLHINIPIVFRDNDSEANECIIGDTTGTCHIVTYDNVNQVYNLTVDGNLYFGGLECIVSKSENKVIQDFEITGIGISK